MGLVGGRSSSRLLGVLRHLQEHKKGEIRVHGDKLGGGKQKGGGKPRLSWTKQRSRSTIPGSREGGEHAVCGGTLGEACESIETAKNHPAESTQSCYAEPKENSREKSNQELVIANDCVGFTCHATAHFMGGFTEQKKKSGAKGAGDLWPPPSAENCPLGRRGNASSPSGSKIGSTPPRKMDSALQKTCTCKFSAPSPQPALSCY